MDVVSRRRNYFLVLSFTSTGDKRYWADNRNYDRCGRLNIETYRVGPAARDPLADYFRTGIFVGGGLGNEQQLSEKSFTATAEFNEWRQLGLGIIGGEAARRHENAI